MDFATILGIAISCFMMVFSISAHGNLYDFFDLPSFLLVFGGTMGATLTQYPLFMVIRVGSTAIKTFVTNSVPHESLITNFTNMATIARRDGLLALDPTLDDINDPFTRKGLQLAVDGLDPISIRNILEAEIENTQARHEYGVNILESMASYAPALGMIGTVIGLVQMLHEMQDPSSIGPKMAMALITTFYGVVLANLLFLPLAGKLRFRSREEIFAKEMSLEGILGIVYGENPRILREKLSSFQSPRDRKEMRQWYEDV